MSDLEAKPQPVRRTERLLAGLLRYGALSACAWIGVGLALEVLNRAMGGHVLGVNPKSLLAAGIVILILLPVLRVALMLLIFLFEKDYRFVAISGLVLLVILGGFLMGILNAHLKPG